MGQTNFGVLDLSIAGFIAQVMTDFPNVGDTSGGDWVTL
jgi:hypothetical protein